MPRKRHFRNIVIEDSVELASTAEISGGTIEDSVIAEGEQLTVQSGGELEIESGGVVDVESGGYLKLAGTAITATAAELNKNAGVTAGAVTASKALVVGASKELASLGAVTIDTIGSLTAGALSSANDISGVALTASKSKAVGIHADSGGSALTAGNIRATLSRMLIGTAISSGADISTYGLEGLLKSIVSVNVGGNQGGVLGHYESAGTLTLTGSINTIKAGVAAFIDLAANATIAAGTVISAFGVNPANFGTTRNGRASIIHVTNPMAGVWDAFLDLSTATGLTQDSAVGATGDKWLKVYLNGVLYNIAMVRAA
jgi:hypothetical protein